MVVHRDRDGSCDKNENAIQFFFCRPGLTPRPLDVCAYHVVEYGFGVSRIRPSTAVVELQGCPHRCKRPVL